MLRPSPPRHTRPAETAAFDAAGEWYADALGRLVVRLPSGVDDISSVATWTGKVNTYALAFTDAANLVLRGLSFYGTTVLVQVTHSGPTLSTVAQPQAIERLDAPGVGPAQLPSPTGAHVARLGASMSPMELTPSGQWRTARPLCVLQVFIPPHCA